MNCVGQCVRFVFRKFVGRLSTTVVMNAICFMSEDIVPPARAARRLSAHVPLSYQNVGKHINRQAKLKIGGGV